MTHPSARHPGLRRRQPPLRDARTSLTKFLPDRYRGAIDYVEVRGRTKIVIKGQISDYIPNPTFDVVARPGAMEDYFRKGNPEGKDRAGDLRRADAGDPAPSASPRPASS